MWREKRQLCNNPDNYENDSGFSFFLRHQVRPYCPNHKAAMSLGLCRMISLVILVIAAILFTGLYKYQEEIMKMATIIVPGKTNVQYAESSVYFNALKQIRATSSKIGTCFFTRSCTSCKIDLANSEGHIKILERLSLTFAANGKRQK